MNSGRIARFIEMRLDGSVRCGPVNGSPQCGRDGAHSGEQAERSWCASRSLLLAVQCLLSLQVTDVHFIYVHHIFFQTEKKGIVENGLCLQREMDRKRSVYRAVPLCDIGGSRAGVLGNSSLVWWRQRSQRSLNLGTILVAEMKCQTLSVPYFLSYSGFYWYCICYLTVVYQYPQKLSSTFHIIL